MKWNWQLPEWPQFTYDTEALESLDREFLLGFGGLKASLKHLNEGEKKRFAVEILSVEGLESAKIEGEILDRESLQSSIQRNLRLKVNQTKERPKEKGMADLMCEVYENFNNDLTHDTVKNWHRILFQNTSYSIEKGDYRKHEEPMQIISHRYGDPKIYFEAPPSKTIPKEMDTFINWFNKSRSQKSILGRAAHAHVYFESIHPFEDGNGRIGRALSEMALSQSAGYPVLIAMSLVMETKKKDYYKSLEACNRTLEITPWTLYFAKVVLQAQQESIRLIDFLIVKSKLMEQISGKINPRQEKVLLRIFEAGVEGFKGGLSAENYISITKVSRATATRDLADLVEQGILYKTGELRHTRYWVSALNQ